MGVGRDVLVLISVFGWCTNFSWAQLMVWECVPWWWRRVAVAMQIAVRVVHNFNFLLWGAHSNLWFVLIILYFLCFVLSQWTGFMDSRPHGHMLRIAWVGYCAEKCGCDEKLDCNSKNFHLHTISFIVVFFFFSVGWLGHLVILRLRTGSASRFLGFTNQTNTNIWYSTK